MGRLGADASRAIEVARELARKHRHEKVEPEHLLGALLADPRMEQLLTEHAVDRKDLEQQLIARLAAWPVSGLYRDALAEPVLSAAFESLIARAGAERLVALVRPVTLVQLARAACSEPRLSLLLWEASTEVGSTKDALAQARTFALSRREGWVSIFHLFAVLVEQAPLKNALREAQVDPDALGERIVMRLDDEPRAEEVVHDGLAKLGDLGVLLAALLRTKAIDELLTDLGTSVLELIQALVRSAGESFDEDSLPEDGDAAVDIVFHDDDFTTQEFVVRVLNQCFAVPEKRAHSIMRTVHGGGAVAVKAYPASEARWRLQKGREMARREGMPLRISWRLERPPRDPDRHDA